MIPKHHDAAIRLGGLLLLHHFHLGADGVTRSHRTEEAATLHCQQGNQRMLEQRSGLGGGKRHGEMARADDAAPGRSAGVLGIDEQRHLVTDQLAKGVVIGLGDEAGAGGNTLPQHEIVPEITGADGHACDAALPSTATAEISISASLRNSPTTCTPVEVGRAVRKNSRRTAAVLV